jgi:hypothetical protein
MTSRTANHGTPAATTSTVIRDFIRAGGRILVTPAGELTEGGGVPWPFISGSDEEAAECLRAGRAYFSVRERAGVDRRISRAVRILGRRTTNGWLVLEARSEAKESLH